MFPLIFWFLVGIFFGFWGMALGRERTPGAGGGFALGLFLNIIGLLVLVCLPKIKEKEADSVAYESILQSSISQERALDSDNSNASNLKECPYCWELLEANASICKFCNHEISNVPENTPVFPEPEDLVIEQKMECDV